MRQRRFSVLSYESERAAEREWNRIETLVPLGDLANLDRVRRSHHPERPSFLFAGYSCWFDQRLFQNLPFAIWTLRRRLQNVIRQAGIGACYVPEEGELD